MPVSPAFLRCSTDTGEEQEGCHGAVAGMPIPPSYWRRTLSHDPRHLQTCYLLPNRETLSANGDAHEHPSIQKVVYCLSAMKRLIWVGSSLDDLQMFPADARRLAGHQLDLVQRGFEPDDWKTMRSIGPGAYEIRIHTALEHRVCYVAKFEEGIYVLHAFEKKTQQTTRRDLNLARERLRAVLRSRQAQNRHSRR